MYLEFMNWNLWRYNLKKHYQYVLVTTVTQNENMEEFCFSLLNCHLVSRPTIYQFYLTFYQNEHGDTMLINYN